MKALALLVLLIATPALSESAYYEAFDFKNCLHWNIDNEMHGADLGKEPKQYLARKPPAIFTTQIHVGGGVRRCVSTALW